MRKQTIEFNSNVSDQIKGIEKELLEKNKHKFTSFSCIGDADYIVEYTATEAVHNRFEKEIYDLLETAPKENPGEKLVESFKISSHPFWPSALSPPSGII